MGALNFDPFAVLAELQSQKPAPAIVATPATLEDLAGSSVATVAGVAGGHPQFSKCAEPSGQPAIRVDGDPEAYLSHLHEHGPKPYGAVATALGWGATRAWQAEAKLRASGRLTIDSKGRGVAKGGKP